MFFFKLLSKVGILFGKVASGSFGPLLLTSTEYERGTLVIVLMNIGIIFVRELLWLVGSSLTWSTMDKAGIAINVACGMTTVTSLILFFFALYHLSLQSKNLATHAIVVLIAFCGAVVTWASPSPFYDTLLGYQIDTVGLVGASPIAHCFVRQLVDKTYTRKDAIISAVVCSGVLVYFFVDASMEIYQLVGSSTYTFGLFLLGDILSIVAFIVQIFLGFKVYKSSDMGYSQIMVDAVDTPY